MNSFYITKSLDFYLSNINFILSLGTRSFISLRTAKVQSIFQSASLIAQEIACKLEQKRSFRLICRILFQQLANCRYVKGIRVACSGRLNGAEIAKTECRKFGETSLHVFSEKIDYAQAKASTPYGILGIKVWISYI
jgi:small subunit ribosomal protein S3